MSRREKNIEPIFACIKTIVMLKTGKGPYLLSKYCCLICGVFFLSLHVFAQVPVINSFSPLTGPVGTEVIIKGNNFNINPSSNIVYFGAMKAAVINAADTQLTVSVPSGATYDPLTVTTNGLTAYSTSAFDVTFPGGGVPLTANSFATPQHICWGGFFTINDLDDDGKTDMPISFNGQSLNVLKNNTNGNYFSFATLRFPVKKYTGIISPAKGDFDGDGRIDEAWIENDSDRITIFRNTTANGVVSFAVDTVIRPATYAHCMAVGDMDGDGKPDIVVGGYKLLSLSNTTYDTISIYRNTSANGKISFTRKTIFTTLESPLWIGVADLNGDKKPDIVTVNYVSDALTLLQNTSTADTLSFTAGYTTINTDGCIRGAISDIDGDGKPDLIMPNYAGSGVEVVRNTSTLQTISFATMGAIKSYATGSRSYYATAGDVDGDGKPDIICTNWLSNNVSVLRNTSSGSTLSFAAKLNIELGSGSSPNQVNLGDFDSDGKPDIAFNSYGHLHIARNQIGEPIIVNLCPVIRDTLLTSNIKGTVYQWQCDTTGQGFTDITGTDTRFAGINDSVLLLKKVSTNWYGYKFRCVVNGNYSNSFTLRFTSTWLGMISTNWEDPGNWSCGILPDSNTDVYINRRTAYLNSNQSIRKLIVTFDPSTSNPTIAVMPPYNLTITH